MRPALPLARDMAGLLGMVLWVSSAAAEQPPVPPVAAFPSSPNQVGVVAAVSSTVEITSRNGATRHVRSGEAVQLGDVVKTNATGRLQILLLDETIFTIGPDSAMTIGDRC